MCRWMFKSGHTYLDNWTLSQLFFRESTYVYIKPFTKIRLKSILIDVWQLWEFLLIISLCIQKYNQVLIYILI